MRTIQRWHETNTLSAAHSGKLNFSREDIEALSRKIVGRLVLPQDSTYNIDRTTFMAGYQGFPQIIVYCEGFNDVIAALRFAKEVDLHPVCRAGGHSAAAYSVNDDMVIDVSGINYVRVDERKKTALVGGGTNFRKIYAELDLYGLHVPGGGCESVCVGGYMQGGGYSYTSLMFGMNCDSVTGACLALADGTMVETSARKNADLFWAIRGGTGNNFGVLLEVQYKLRELGLLWGFGFKWPIRNEKEAEIASKAAAVWQKNFTGDDVPENVGTQSLLVFTRDNEKEELCPHYVIRGLCNGSEADCTKIIEPILSLVPKAATHRDIWKEGTYTELNGYLEAYPTALPPDVPASARSIGKSHIVGHHLNEEEWLTLIHFFMTSPNSNNFIGLEAYGGAINKHKQEATAFWHRKASLDVFMYSFWMQENARGKAMAFMDEFNKVAEPITNGHSYQNYPNRANTNFGEMYFGGNLSRLKEIKKKYDPNNLFSFQQSLDQA